MADDPTDDDGPTCETCGKPNCPDADLPSFSEPRACAYAPVYEAIKDAKDCDYGCSRDYTNQAVCLWVAPAVERIVDAARATALREATDEMRRMMDGFPQRGRHTRASWALAWLERIAERDNTPAATEGADRG